ncbi:MAG: two-component sensor histidine kinase [Planctomycetaceae bacterium]|nr:two-component sensor histidine kinase [Planctomycetaceae bacterium]
MNRPLDEQERERLESQYAEIASLAGGLAHEIRNPLSTIRMNLALLFEDLEESDFSGAHRIQRKLQMIQRECSHLEEILEAFLQFARAGELTLEAGDLSALVQEFIDFYRPEAEQHGIDISPHLATHLPPIDMDENLMRQVLGNLVRNAQQAMPDGGLLELQTYSRDGAVVLEIIDTGCGMSPAALEKMFEIFFSTKSSGSGLGLPTVRKIVKAHRGTIQCESTVGSGTRFTLTFPASASAAT